MTAEMTASDWMKVAVRRARASRRRPGSTEWPSFAPPVGLASGPLGVVQAADREIARQTAVRAVAVAEFAAVRPASVDRQQGQAGAMSPERWAGRSDVLRSVSEWAGQELAVALSISGEAAEGLLERSLTLVHRLPGTLAALQAGAMHPGHLWPMLDKVGPIESPTVRAEVEAGLLRWAAGRVTTPAQLGAKARREVARCDARAAARQLETAIRQRGVQLRPGTVDGTAAVTALLTEPEGRVMVAALGKYADAIPDDPENPRTRGQKMADCLLDLVLRPGENGLPPVQVLLTMVASIGTLAGGDDPGEIDGQVVPAEMIRELLRLLAPSTSAPADIEPQPQAQPEPTTACDKPANEEPWPQVEACGDGDEPAVRQAGADEPAVREAGVVEPAVREAGVVEPAVRQAGVDEPPASDADPLPPWQHTEQAELERWWSEMERRVLADELGPQPEPMPDPGSPCWSSSGVEPPEWETCDDAACVHESPEWAAYDWDDPEDREGPDLAPGRKPPDQPDPDRTVPSSGAGWWAEADQAVDEAGLALLRFDQATARAGQLVRTASAADAGDEDAWQAARGRFTDAENALSVLRACSDEQRQHLSDLLSANGGGGLVERPRIALTDALTGALLALTDLPELRRTGCCGARACRRNPADCTHDLTGRPGLEPPGPTDGYRPAAGLDRWVRARDRRCRFPGCRRRVPRGGELDHDRPYPDGTTSAANLAGYCTGHHRGKHQAPGWQHSLDADGTLTVTTPTGLTATTTPPPY